MDTGDVEQTQQRLHSLRGAAGTVGADQVQALATGLEHAIRAGQPLPELWSPFEALATAHATLIAALTPILEPDPDAAPAVIDWPSAQAAVVRLETLLAEDDIQANEVFLELAPALRAAWGETVRILERQINGFAYPQALETLRRLVAEHPELRGDPTG